MLLSLLETSTVGNKSLSKMNYSDYSTKLASRFRDFLPVVIDIETSGIDAKTAAILEIAALTIDCNAAGEFFIADSVHFHVEPFKGANFCPKSLEINGIDPYHPFRFAISEKLMLQNLFKFCSLAQKQTKCRKSVLVAHNAWFDLAFLNAAIVRCELEKKNPFHAFTCLDTATMGMIAYGHSVLAEILKRANIEFDHKAHHSALYDATKTAELFCKILNSNAWPEPIS